MFIIVYFRDINPLAASSRVKDYIYASRVE